jgi:uncharacterized protein YutD
MIAIIVVLIVLIISTYCSYIMGKYNNEMSNLRGFWETDKTFNDESGISVFTMYIGKYKNGSYPVYLLMVDTDENILINTPSQMKLSQVVLNNTTDYYREFNVCFSDLNSELIPNNIMLRYHSKSSKIVLSGNDTVYGCLFKNAQLSDIDLIKESLGDKKESFTPCDKKNKSDDSDSDSDSDSDNDSEDIK